MTMAWYHARRLLAAALLAVLAVACDEPSAPTVAEVGTITVTTATVGGDQDSSGYLIVIGSVRRAIASNARVVIGVSAGTHTVKLEGIAENCIVRSPYPLAVTVPAGGDFNLAFEIVCQTTGVEINTRTTGTDAPALYGVLVNGLWWGTIGPNDLLIANMLPPGPHTVALSIPGAHCSVWGGNQITVDVVNRTVTPVWFDVTCAPPLMRPVAIFENEPVNRYVLYADSTFRLERSIERDWITGTYSRIGSVFTFTFSPGDLWSSSPGRSYGETRGDLLDVRYDHVMNYEGFTDAEYVLSLAATAQAQSAEIFIHGPDNTRFLLYADGSFRLEYASRQDWYGGTYSRNAATLTFAFDGFETDGGATGEVRGDSLVVRYNGDMGLIGFTDGEYKRSSEPAP